MSFTKGQRVVCVKEPSHKCILKGEIYTIAGFTSQGGILITGVRNNGTEGTGWWGYHDWRFRPMDESFGKRVLESINFNEDEVDEQLQSA